MDKISLVWLRQDLRLSDNPALLEAVKSDQVYIVYILDDENAGSNKMGAASRWRLHQSLAVLERKLGGNLNLYKGAAEKIIPEIIAQNGITDIHWNRCYEPWRIKRDRHIKATLIEAQVFVHSHNASLLWEPWEVLKKDGTPYRVFTPFYKNGCLANFQPRSPHPAPKHIPAQKDRTSISLQKLDLIKGYPWFEKLNNHWPIGEEAALERSKEFLKSDIKNYKIDRNFPYKTNSSYLSPNLHFGEISPHQLWELTELASRENDNEWVSKSSDINHFKNELGWREFSYYLNYHFADMQKQNFNKKYDEFSWDYEETHYAAWCHGKTGIPIVDAAQRQLWQTGLMHNRLRMISASFLVKNLLIDWRRGERWFWDCLLDADSASNGASWQWVAGCGADAAPYFRVFNPVLQSKKFDPDGTFLKKYVPELCRLPLKYLYEPWEAPEEILSAAGIELGKTYPKPIVNLKTSREAALAQYKLLTGKL
ncbi:deoxyribodipyrimidine photo-lyase [Temperatibacter marinus]|uniref:Deoxyribodipyrimidine photo-lyase n=1 Tax=Temperatibacter marinus TaxID=1456591 RepID=A0AA52EF51_9PROT|nr:deoxyribodipyrimidine photo-lyase [Temperatibacter marinus]WND02518.1 deoxyribodipyrimidine photo-lyase [Temperatibacter marinus]